MANIQNLKQRAAEFAVENFIHSSMLVGLGVGSTAIFAVRKLGELIASGTLTEITAIPCSEAVKREALELSIPLVEFSEDTVIDVTIDGADEVDPALNLIKGGGGALLREKIVAQASQREVIVVDQSKLSDILGTQWAVPIEVSTFGWQTQAGFLKSIGGQPVLRNGQNGEPYTTDQGNYILDTNFGPIENPSELAAALQHRAGIVEHGLFINLATDLVVAGEHGVEHRTR
jgi:ribose 5-phosphate isomerase A